MKRKGGRPSQEEAEAIHQRIIASATADFMVHGYARASMDRIARQAGTTKQSIYRLYAGKELLFKSVIGAAIHDNAGQVPDFRDDLRPPAEVLRAVAAYMRESAARGVIRGLRNAIMDVRDSFPQLHAEALAFINQSSIAMQLGDYLQMLDREGRLRIERPHSAAFDFALLVSPLPQLLGMTADDFSPDHRIDDVIGLFLRGYAPEAG